MTPGYPILLPMADAVWIAFIVAFTTVASPAILAYFTGRQRSAEKREDYARQDLVAKRVEDAAGQARKAARLLIKSNAQVAATAAATTTKLDVIHDLVNSNMTAAIRESLEATMRERAVMHEVIELKRAAGHEPSAHALAAIVAADQRIAELQATMADRT